MMEMIEPFHEGKDPAHGMEHIHRLRLMAKTICQNSGIPREDIYFAIFFHGLTTTQQDQVESTFISFGKTPEEAKHYRELSTYMSRDAVPSTNEEKVLHDCHVLEGGKYFALIKSIITGLFDDRSIGSSIELYEKKILPKQRCYLSYTRRILKDQQKIMKDMAQNMKEFV